jgi:catechol 2,3-dioxygenase-like lactoylglutathione lyase family enzyme
MRARHPWSLSLVLLGGAFASGAGVARATPSSPSTPELYRKVVGVHWVVRDVLATRAAWARLGFRGSEDLGEISVAGTYHGQSGTTRLRVASGRIAGLDVVWLQPLDGQGAFAEFLARHGEGIFSINYAAPSLEALDAEVGRLSALGVGVLQRAQVPAAEGTLTIVHMDTEPGGKYVLGLVHGKPPSPPAPAAAHGAAPAGDGPPFPARLSQYALVVEDLQAVSDYWARLGFPVMDVTHPALRDLRYHAEPGRFDQKLGWHRHGTVTWEWIQPLAGPTVYRDFLHSHGEGVHHLALDVPDIDAAAKALEALGAPIVQSGAWGETGKPGSGRFAYADTSASGGVTIELLWSKP